MELSFLIANQFLNILAFSFDFSDFTEANLPRLNFLIILLVLKLSLKMTVFFVLEKKLKAEGALNSICKM